MAAMFVGQQFLQNVLEYDTLDAGAAILPAALFMVIVAPRSAKLVEAHGARFTLLIGYVFCFLGFLTMLAAVGRGHPVLEGRARRTRSSASASGSPGTPASHSLTGSVPVATAGMASGTADLQRDLGGAIMQSILGALLTAGYATAFADLIAASPDADQVSDSVQSQLTKSFSSAANTAEQYPQYAEQIIAAAQQSFLDGADWAYTRGDRRDRARRGARLLHVPEARRARRELLAEYHAEDVANAAAHSAA